jgi:hypothetical protein
MSKALKKNNALKHGANAKEVMLWSENYEEYEGLRLALNEEWYPEGKTEETAVQTLLDLLWRRSRLDRYQHITMQKRLDVIREGNERSRHIENMRLLIFQFKEADTAEKVETVLALLSPFYRNSIRHNWPLGRDEAPNMWGVSIASGLSRWEPPARHEEGNEFIKAIDLEEFDKELGRIERIDAMIDRALKRLVQIKTTKQLFVGPNKLKLINPSTTEALPAEGVCQKCLPD